MMLSQASYCPFEGIISLLQNGCRAIDLTHNQEILKILRVEKHDDTVCAVYSNE